MGGYLKSLSVYGDWEDDPDYVPPVAHYSQHFVFEAARHPAKIMLEVLRDARGGLRDDQLERQYIASIKDVLASRDRHVAEGLYWQWAVSERNWKELCEATCVSFGTLEDAADILLDPPMGILKNTKSQWMKRILESSPPTLQHAIFTGGRDGVTVSSAYMLVRTAEQQAKLVRIHQKLARPQISDGQIRPRLKEEPVDLEQQLVDDILEHDKKWKYLGPRDAERAPKPPPEERNPDVQKAIYDADDAKGRVKYSRLKHPGDEDSKRHELFWPPAKKRSPDVQKALDDAEDYLLPPAE